MVSAASMGPMTMTAWLPMSPPVPISTLAPMRMAMAMPLPSRPLKARQSLYSPRA